MFFRPTRRLTPFVGAPPAPADSTPIVPGAMGLLSVGAVSAVAAISGAIYGRPPYAFQFQLAPDASGSPGAWANVGPNAPATSYTLTGLTPITRYWVRCVISDSEGTPQTATAAAVSFTTHSTLPAGAPVFLRIAPPHPPVRRAPALVGRPPIRPVPRGPARFLPIGRPHPPIRRPSPFLGRPPLSSVPGGPPRFLRIAPPHPAVRSRPPIVGRPPLSSVTIGPPRFLRIAPAHPPVRPGAAFVGSPPRRTVAIGPPRFIRVGRRSPSWPATRYPAPFVGRPPTRIVAVPFGCFAWVTMGGSAAAEGTVIAVGGTASYRVLSLSFDGANWVVTLQGVPVVTLSPAAVAIGNKQHIGFTFDAGGTVVVYLDGVAVATATSPVVTVSIGPAWIGSQAGSDVWTGAIDDPRIVSGYLPSAADVAGLWNGGRGNKSIALPGELAHYKFPEGSGTTAHDSSGHGNDATLTSSTAWTGGLSA